MNTLIVYAPLVLAVLFMLGVYGYLKSKSDDEHFDGTTGGLDVLGCGRCYVRKRTQ